MKKLAGALAVPYDVELSPDAFADLDQLDPEQQGLVFDALDRLRASPTRLSSPSVLPSPPGYQMHQFHDQPRRCRFTVLFKYCDNEQTLWVYRIIGRVED